MKDNFKKKGNKTNRDKVGKILLKDEYGKTGPGLTEKKYALLSVMDTFQRKFEFKSIVKAFEITMSNRKKRTISALGSKGTNDYFYNPNQLVLTRVRLSRLQVIGIIVQIDSITNKIIILKIIKKKI